MREIEFSKQAIKVLMKMDRRTSSRIKDKITLLAADPADPSLDTKALAGRANRFRLRVGGWRVIYSDTGLILFVEKIGARGDVYK